MTKNKKLLSKFITLSLLTGSALLPPMVAATDTLTSDGGNFILTFYNKGETWSWEDNSYTSIYTLNDWQKQHLLYGINYWEKVLWPSFTNTTPINIEVVTNKDNNACNVCYISDSITYKNNLVPGIPYHILAGTYGMPDYMVIGEGFYPADKEEDYYLTPLPQLGGGIWGSLTGTAIHELGHGLGIAFFKKTGGYHVFQGDAGLGSFYSNHLYDWRDVQAAPGIAIRTDNHTPGSSAYFDLSGGKYPYFAGEHVSQVLDGAKLTVYSSKGYKMSQDPVPGIPINTVESTWNGEYHYDQNTGKYVGETIDLDHLELRNSMMSHQYFRNYQTFMEAELAVLQDLGYTIDLRNYFGRSVYNNDLTITNTRPYYARNADGDAYLIGTPNTMDYGMGLHVYGNNNTIYQAADLLAGGRAAVGIRVDGLENNIVVKSGTQVRADGLNGNGLLVAYGKNHTLTMEPGSTVTADGEGGIGAAFDFGTSFIGYGTAIRGSYANRMAYSEYSASKAEVDGPLVTSFTVKGSLSGRQAAIFMANNAYVQNVLLGTGAQLSGDITNEWLYDFDDVVANGVTLQVKMGIPGTVWYNPNLDAAFYRQYTGTDELTTHLSFANADGMAYGGTITGLKNTRLSFDAGNTSYTGTAQVLSAQVAAGAALTGSGTFILETPTDAANHTLSYRLNAGETSGDRKLTGVGLFTNKGTLAPTTGNITISGDFSSSGTLGASLKDAVTANVISISGSADVTGSKLALVGASGTALLPLINRPYTYLTAADGITGTVTAAVENPSLYTKLSTNIAANDATFMVGESGTVLGSLPGMTSSEHSAGAALNNLILDTVASHPATAEAQTLNALLYQDEAASRTTMKQITSSDRAQLLTVSPLTAMTTGAVHDRLDTALFDGNINVTVPTASFDGIPGTIQVAAPVTLDTENNLWFKLLRGFEAYGGIDGGYDLHNKSFGGVIGYDKAVNGTTRVGGLFSYAKTDYTTDVMSGDSHDWRIGIYASHDNGTWKTQGLIAYGQNRYDFNRYVLGDKLSSDYKANILDINAKVKYLPQQNRAKSWQVAPYVDMSYTHSSQGSYDESGSIFAQSIDSASNNSWRAEGGVEWKHNMDKTSSWGGNVGYKRVLSGVNPELNGTFVGDNNRFTLKTDNDKDYFTYSLNLRKNTGHNWTVQGEIRGEKSAHNHNEVYSLLAKYSY